MSDVVLDRRRTVFLRTPVARATAHRYIDAAPDSFMVTFSPEVKRRIQEEKYHAMIDDIAKQSDYAGKRWDADDMKRLLVDEFADEMRNADTPLHHDGRLVPSENGRRVIQLGIQTRDFFVREAADFITFLYAYGIDRDVQWTEPVAGVEF